MDPKVSRKLLTTHRKGYGVDVEALHGRFPLRHSAGEGSKMRSRGYRRLQRWKLCFVVPWMFLAYMDIYIGGRSKSVELRGAHEGGGRTLPPGRAPLPRGPPVAPPTYSFLLYIPTYPHQIRYGAKNLISLP